MEEDLEKDMTPKLIGETYLKKATPNSPQRYRFGIHECQYCGREFEVRVYSVKIGNARSCGCQKNKQKITHGRSNSRFYKTWNDMIRRCTNPNNKDYKDYGGRGITVCEEWLDVIDFVAWCEATHPNIEGYSLDRIDNDNGYSPENCRWANRLVQNINQRMKSTNTSGYNGIIWNKKNSNWKAVIGINTKKVYLGYFNSVQEAVQARNIYIIENNLPHKLSTDYKKEN